MRPSNYPLTQTPTSDYGGSPSVARSAHLHPDYIARQSYVQQQHSHGHTGSMAQQPQSPSMSLQDGHQNDHHHPTHIKSNADVPVDPNIAASSPTYPPYSPYGPHDMSHYQGHGPPSGYPPHWPQQYAGHPHGMPGGPYSSPGTGGSAQGTPASAGPRSGQVCYAHSFHINISYSDI